MPPAPAASTGKRRIPIGRRWLGLAAGPLVLVSLLVMEPPEGMTPEAWRTAAVAGLMAVWWMTEAIPISATALLPLVLMPLLDIAPMGAVAAPYANPLVFLFLGGFLIALAVQRWGLHQRIALGVLRAVGTRPDFLVGGFMGATAFLSMWVSNTATAAMMLPIGLSVIALVQGGDGDAPKPQIRHFPVALLLGIAFAANIGGMATLVGTPPNALLAGFMLDNYGLELGFARWMAVGLPAALSLLLLAWWLLTRSAYVLGRQPLPGVAVLLGRRRAALGPMSPQEKRVAVVFAATAGLWLLRPLLDRALPGLSLSDPVIAMAGALALFVIPADWSRYRFLMDWDATRELPWGVLVLVGGGLSLGTAVEASGLAGWVGTSLQAFAAWPLFALVLLVAAMVMLISHITSNTATAAAFIPLVAALALSLGDAPLSLAVPTVLAASCAFMLPVATPPNAIVFGSGMLTVGQMARAGAVLSLAALLVIVLVARLLVEPLLG